MRERLTLAFVVLSILLLLGAGFVRSFILRDLIREQEGVHVQQQVVLVAKVVTARQQEGGMADPDVVDDDHAVAAPIREEITVARDGRLVIFRYIGEAVL